MTHSTAPVRTTTDFSRRNFFRMAAGASALATMPLLSEMEMARAQMPRFTDPDKGIHIDANENPLGPSAAARQAIEEIIPRSGRYLFPYKDKFTDLFAETVNVKPENVVAFAGSTQALHFAILAHTSKERGLVMADPGYEPPMWAAKFNGAPIFQVPLADPRGKASHDVRAMLKATATPGVIYLCNPNNPTGTATSRAEIEYAVENAPKDTLVLIDEAYIHFSDEQPSLDFVRAGRNVIVLRTFSKLYGMAGLRLGCAIGREDLVKQLVPYGADNPLPVTAVAAGRASLLEKDLVATRKKINAETREAAFAWLRDAGYNCTPSVSNCFLLDVKRPGREVIAALAQKNVFVGRLWPSWPTWVRITVGTPEEMQIFRKAFSEVMSRTTAHFGEPPVKAWRREFPYARLS